MKKIFVFLLFVTLLAFSASAGELLVDNAGLLDDYERDVIRGELEEIKSEYDMSVAIVTTNSLDGKSARDYADDWFDYNVGDSHGVIFLVAMFDREWHISTKGDAIDIFTSSRLDTVEESVIPLLSDGRYYTAFSDFIKLSRDWFDKPQPLEEEKREVTPARILVPVGFGLIVGLITVCVMASQLKSVKSRSDAGDYVKSGSFNLTQSYDRFLWRRVNRVRRQNNSSSSGTHRSSSGSFHGGRGGRF